ncbi:MAG TPA: hypothetical protein VGR29_12035 [Thermomicrobiales bacterium]|nr:hypothetical protein [Thermomicrobiales bacterium]
MSLPRISRRTFGTGLALSVPAVVAAHNATAQTPVATPEVASAPGTDTFVVPVRPHDILAALLATPFDIGSTLLGMPFEPRRWTDIGQSPYISSVGGVLIQRSDGAGDAGDQILGGYGVYLQPEGAQAARQLGELAHAEAAIETWPLVLGGLQGITIVHGIGSPEVLTLVPVDNVLVIARDIDLGEGESDRGRTVIFRSVRHATVLLDHLERITSLQTWSRQTPG